MPEKKTILRSVIVVGVLLCVMGFSSIDPMPSHFRGGDAGHDFFMIFAGATLLGIGLLRKR